MAPYLRLRQICLTSVDLPGATARIKEVLGLEECYRDSNVAKYGLENVLFPVAGPEWQRAIRNSIARSLRAVEIECPDPDAFASHWGKILERPVQSARIALDAGAIHFLPGTGPEPVFAGVVLEAAARATLDLCGVRFRLVDA